MLEIGVTGLTNLDKSPGPQNIESLRSNAKLGSGNLNGDGSFEEVGLSTLEEAIEAGLLILASRLSCLLTAREG